MSARNTKKSTAGFQYGLLVTLAAMTIAGCGGGGSGSSGGGGVGGAGTPAPSPVPTPSPAPAPTAAAPSIAAQPAAVIVADGAIAQFTISAAGAAPLTYQWRRNGVDLADGVGIVGASTATMSLTAQYVFNTSQMSVRVSNAGGNVVSGNALLTVTPVAPMIATQPANTTATARYIAVLSATITGGTAPVSYQWKRDGKIITGATSTSYSVDPVNLRDNGAVFVLDVTNPAGTLSSQPATLTVKPTETATVFTVDTTDDLVDSDTADGVCLTGANNCSLRAAIMQADVMPNFATDINVPPGIYKLTISPRGDFGGDNGNLNLTKPMIPEYFIFITGAGAGRTIIDGGARDNLLEIWGGRKVTLTGLTLRNGRTLSNNSGGIIANHGGNLTISDSVIEYGRTANAGGGIYSEGELSVDRSTISSNSAENGGGVFSWGIAHLRDSTVNGNRAVDGGGIYNVKTTYLVNSTVSTNSADRNGGGIYAAVSIPNAREVKTYVYSSSIVGNDADHDHDEIGGNGGGVFNGAGSPFLVVNSLLMRNTLRDSPQYSDCHGALEMYGFDVFGDVSDCTLSGSSASWTVLPIETVDPVLKDNGGPTFTHMLLDASDPPHNVSGGVCIDEIGERISTDQRGGSRADGCDVGAIEYGAVAP